SASRPGITRRSSACFSGCTICERIQGPGWDWRSYAKALNGWAAGRVLNRFRGGAAVFGWIYRQWRGCRMENRILHVEDNPDDVMLMALAFRKAGATVKLEVAVDG